MTNLMHAIIKQHMRKLQTWRLSNELNFNSFFIIMFINLAIAKVSSRFSVLDHVCIYVCLHHNA